MNTSLSVAIFVYNRVGNTQKTIDHLLANTLAKDTDVYVFSDGGKDEKSWKAVNEVRDMLRNVKTGIDSTGALKSMTIVERPENYYLERNIIEGIGYVLERSETVIVLEDDICTSPYFLAYMQEAFNMYRDDEKVMHVSGFTNLDLINEHPGILGNGNETYFTPHMAGWGWGTWRSKWQKHFRHYKNRPEALEGFTTDDENAIQYGGVFPCLKSLDKSPIPWDICWEIAIYRAGGLCLTPAYTLVQNIGLRNGTHFRSFKILQDYNFDRLPLTRALLIGKGTPQADPRIEALFAEAITDWGIRYTWLGKIIRRIIKAIRKFK